jgi:hypothetical protein
MKITNKNIGNLIGEKASKFPLFKIIFVGKQLIVVQDAHGIEGLISPINNWKVFKKAKLK